MYDVAKYIIITLLQIVRNVHHTRSIEQTAVCFKFSIHRFCSVLSQMYVKHNISATENTK